MLTTSSLNQFEARADAMLITAGAGMGVTSGLPDFRGNDAFWNTYPPLAKRGLSFADMATPKWFRDDPELAWGFYGHRLRLYRDTNPHDGFKLLLDAGGRISEGYFVVISNVDDQFQKVGYHRHGYWRCSDPSIDCSAPNRATRTFGLVIPGICRWTWNNAVSPPSSPDVRNVVESPVQTS
jgi:NAD-dependent SIR2 family protein deacetylase